MNKYAEKYFITFIYIYIYIFLFLSLSFLGNCFFGGRRKDFTAALSLKIKSCLLISISISTVLIHAKEYVQPSSISIKGSSTYQV